MDRQIVQQLFFFAILVLTTFAFVGLIEDFLLPIFWAVVLTILFRPVQRRWEEALGGRPSLAAALTLLTIILVVLLPLFLVGLAVARETISLYEKIAADEINLLAPIDFFERMLPTIAGYLDEYGIEIDRLRENLSSTAVAASQFLAQRALAIGQNALTFTVLLFVMLYVLFFFLRDGDRYKNALIRVLPLGDVRERWLFNKFAEVARATIKGTLVVAAVQGTLGGLAFWMLGITAPVFWGVLMTLFALLPAVGSAIVWVPAAVILLITGEIVKGLVLIAFGSLIIGLVDNFLRPMLVSRDTKMPDFLVLLSTLGGLTAFGLSGFVIGPVIAAFFLAVWEMFAREYAEEKNSEAMRKAAEEAMEEALREVQAAQKLKAEQEARAAEEQP